jgi:TolB-like protein
MFIPLPVRLIVVSVSLATATICCAAQDLRALSSQIAERVNSSGRKSVAVMDFTDLEGRPTRLGRYLAEEFSVALLSDAKSFEVIDRTHLNTLMQEHKLATSGLIDPSTARTLGKIAGVDALVTGTLTPFEEHVRLSVKVLDTECAKMIAADAGDVPKTKTISDLIASDSAPPSSSGVASSKSSSQTGSTDAPMPPPITRDELSFVVRSCRNIGTKTSCVFGITNKADTVHRVYFTNSSFLVDDLGNQYHPQFVAASGPFFNSNSADLIPDVTVNLPIEVSNVPGSAKVMNASLSYSLMQRTDQYVPPIRGTILIKAIPISH